MMKIGDEVVMRRHRTGRRNSRKLIMISSICLLFVMTAGYAAFSTNLNITAKGNIIDIKAEVDSKVPTNELLFWGQADNEENTLNILKDKSGNNNDGVLNGFDNTETSGYNDDGLVFDGINDYVNIGLANYDFQNSISLVMYVNVKKIKTSSLISNTEGSGVTINLNLSSYKFQLAIYNGTEYIHVTNDKLFDVDKYYTIIGTYDGNVAKVYIDGGLKANEVSLQMTNSIVPMFIGANPSYNNNHDAYTNMVLNETMVYDRALTDDEIKTITEGFERKYQ